MSDQTKHCAKCNYRFKNPHILLMQLGRAEGKNIYCSRYLQKCTHDISCGEPWCPDCCFMVGGPDTLWCSICAGVDWGCPNDYSVDFYVPEEYHLDDKALYERVAEIEHAFFWDIFYDCGMLCTPAKLLERVAGKHIHLEKSIEMIKNDASFNL